MLNTIVKQIPDKYLPAFVYFVFGMGVVILQLISRILYTTIPNP